MQGFELPRDQVNAGLRAMKMVASANGVFSVEERDLIQCVAEVFEVPVDPDALEAITPQALAAIIVDPAWRLRTVQALVVIALIDGEASPSEVSLVDAYAAALEVKDARLKNMHQLLDGKLLFLRLDILRRQPLGQKIVRQAVEAEGVRGALKIVRMALFGQTALDPDQAWRFKQLGLLPPGTLGREFWAHMTKNRFAFPGEHHGVPELGMHHDLTHVLAGFDTDPEGEIQIASFYAGYLKEDPFSFVFMVLVMFHLGVKVSPIATPAKGKFDPQKVIRAMQRGAAINIDFTEKWDWWKDAALPIDEVRRKYNVLPP